MSEYSREIMDFIATRHLRQGDLTPNENHSFEIKDAARMRTTKTELEALGLDTQKV